MDRRCRITCRTTGVFVLWAALIVLSGSVIVLGWTASGDIGARLYMTGLGAGGMLMYSVPFKVWSAVVTGDALVPGLPRSRRMLLSELDRVERGQGADAEFLMAVLRDGSQARVLKACGAIFISPRTVTRLHGPALRKIEAAIEARRL